MTTNPYADWTEVVPAAPRGPAPRITLGVRASRNGAPWLALIGARSFFPADLATCRVLVCGDRLRIVFAPGPVKIASFGGPRANRTFLIRLSPLAFAPSVRGGKCAGHIVERDETGLTVEFGDWIYPPGQTPAAAAPAKPEAAPEAPDRKLNACAYLLDHGRKTTKLEGDRWIVDGRTMNRDQVAALINALRLEERKPRITPDRIT